MRVLRKIYLCPTGCGGGDARPSPVCCRLGYTAAAERLVVDQYRRASEAGEYSLQLVSYPLST